jgi:hypothetical protein
MSESVIEIKPRVIGNVVPTEWGVYVDGELIAYSRHHFNCDLFAERLKKVCDNVRVDHHPELIENPYKNGM